MRELIFPRLVLAVPSKPKFGDKAAFTVPLTELASIFFKLVPAKVRRISPLTNDAPMVCGVVFTVIFPLTFSMIVSMISPPAKVILPFTPLISSIVAVKSLKSILPFVDWV